MLVDTSADPAVTATQQQDVLRPLRLFVNTFGVMLNDQSYAGQDGFSYNPPNQGVVYNPGYGVAVEGKPIALTSQGGVVISPALVLIGLGVLAALAWKH